MNQKQFAATTLRKTREGSFAVLGGSVIIAYGFVGVATSTFLSNLTQLGTGDYLRLWTLAILTIVCGFVIVLAGFLIASDGTWRVWGGGIIGILGSLIGVVVSLALILTIVGLEASNAFTFGSNAQFNTSFELLVIGSIPTMFVGFPLSMYGSAGGVMSQDNESAEVLESQP